MFEFRLRHPSDLSRQFFIVPGGFCTASVRRWDCFAPNIRKGTLVCGPSGLDWFSRGRGELWGKAARNRALTNIWVQPTKVGFDGNRVGSSHFNAQGILHVAVFYLVLEHSTYECFIQAHRFAPFVINWKTWESCRILDQRTVGRIQLGAVGAGWIPNTFRSSWGYVIWTNSLSLVGNHRIWDHDAMWTGCKLQSPT